MSVMSLDAKLLQILACPQDKGSLYYFSSDAFLYNPRLQRKYNIVEGIPVMLYLRCNRGLYKKASDEK